MRKTEQTAATIRVLHPPLAQREAQTYPDGCMLPPRSRLYGMAPCGEGLWSESLTSYLNRLGWRHGVPPRWLVVQEMVPYLSSDHLLPQLDTFCRQRAMSLNGNGSLALEWSAVLERLTGRPDLHWLTLHGWIGDLSDHGHLRLTPAWCPLCYSEWREQCSPIYQPQIWMFRVITHCPRHHRKLEDRCLQCHKPQSMLATHKSRPGQCTQCGAWLDTGLAMQPGEQSDEELQWQAWVIHTLEEMRLTSVSFHLLQWEHFFTNLATCLKELKGYVKFAHLTGFDRSLFYRWPGRTNVPRTRTLSHPYIPSLGTLLECCYACDITPLQVMMNQLEPLRDLIQGKKVAQSPRPRRLAPQRINRQKCLELMRAILDATGEPLSIRQLAKRLGCRERVLTNHFPQECMLIAKRAQEYRKQRQEQRVTQVQDQVRQTVIALHEQGIFPSHRRLKMMFPPGVMRMPEANVAWHASLRELGLEQ
jgi:hypothetical protein